MAVSTSSWTTELMAASDIPVSFPVRATRAGWQCPACLTVYSPDVKQCDCATVPFGDRIRREQPIRIGGTTPRCTCALLVTGPCPEHPFVQMIC